MHPLIKPVGDHKRLLCYQKAEIIYDITYHFAHTYLERGDRTVDQMVQAARSGKQNIVEGNADLVTSKEIGIKLLNVARASLQELRSDYEDYLRVKGCKFWMAESDEVRYVRELSRQSVDSSRFMPIVQTRSDEVVANMVLVLLHQADYLLQKFIEHVAEKFIREGGFREKMTHARLEERGKTNLGK